MRWMIFGIACALGVCAACKSDVKYYCDEDTPCQPRYPDRPYCDLTGEYDPGGVSNTCVPNPFDAGITDSGVEPDGPTVDASADCVPDSVTCSNGQVVTCSPQGTVQSTQDCALGCRADGKSCDDLAPSNGLGPQLDDAANAPVVSLDPGATINTSDGTITGTTVAIPTSVVTSNPVDILVVKVKSLTAQDIRVTGSRALAIVSDGDVVLSGILDASADHQHAGPGAPVDDPTCQGKDGSKTSDNTAIGGGGGAGFGTAGGAGGSGSALAPGGSGGAATGSATVSPLRGGCHGGWYGGSSGPPSLVETDASPGAGGGAVQIVSRTKIEFTAGAGIAVNGGSAKADTSILVVQCVLGRACGPGAGAGSGGGILLEAPVVAMAASSALVANGGAGHCGTKGKAASPTIDDTPAPGTSCGGFSGGSGAAGSSSAVAGTTASSMMTGTGAGGGGGAGRIRVNLAPGASFDPAGAVVSPPASIGAVGTR